MTEVRTVTMRNRWYVVDWNVERMRWELYGRIPDQRTLFHWACVNEDAA